MGASPFDKRWLLLAGAVAALGLGLLLPRPGGPEHAAASAEPTVPPSLAVSREFDRSSHLDASPTPNEMAVYVCGAVRNPGVYTFAGGSRVVDALKQAGGPLPDADIEQINLAQPLSDAMKVTVPHKGQILAASAPATDDAVPSVRHHHRSHGRGSRGAHKLADGQTLNVNSATAEELVQLPGVGPSLAQRIVDYREQNGPFQTVDDLQNVPGIGPSKFERLAPFVRL